MIFTALPYPVPRALLEGHVQEAEPLELAGAPQWPGVERIETGAARQARRPEDAARYSADPYSGR